MGMSPADWYQVVYYNCHKVRYAMHEFIANNSILFREAVVGTTFSGYKTQKSYLRSLRSFEDNVKKLINALPEEELPVTDVRRHAIIVLGVVNTLAEYLNDCRPTNYVQGYLPIVDRAVPLLWEDPTESVKSIKNHIQDIFQVLEKVENSIQNHCQGSNKWRCGYVLGDVFPDYDRSTKLLNLIAAFNLQYRNMENELKREVQSFNAPRFLINGRERLKPLVEAVAGIYKMIYGVKCMKRK
ncbi:hypothetical protein evm_005043 [Chilo suppressalis]|nr:hypothetical protein evm_005043 [Chilo suppressalis]